jgi:hypothetical protein
MSGLPNYEHTSETLPSLSGIADGIWLVTTHRSEYLWDLDRGRYSRYPAPGSTPLPYDDEEQKIARVSAWPTVGARARVAVVDRSAPKGERWHWSSAVEKIERLHDPRRFRVLNGFLVGVHLPDQCAGRNCWIHNPSGHPLDKAPIYCAEGVRVLRICDHGMPHRDPDDLDYVLATRSMTRDDIPPEDCDGCCRDAGS